MLTAPLPAALEQALRALSGSGGGDAAAAADLSRRYRDAERGSGPVARSPEDVSAYVATRLPATYAAVRIALGELRARTLFEPASQLDLGAGPGTAIWAAADLWPSLRHATAVEPEAAMARLGRELAARSVSLPEVEWAGGTLPRAVPAGLFDLVTLGYVLGELDGDAQAATLDRAWAATAGALVVVEPGTPAGYRRVLAARDRLVAAGGTVVAPCPHDRTCPLVGTEDWCHFAVRVARTSTHRLAKEAQLGHEDEKFAYVVVARAPAAQATARILRHPQLRRGHVVLELCAPEGLRTETVSKRDHERYRLARKLSWGDDLG